MMILSLSHFLINFISMNTIPIRANTLTTTTARKVTLLGWQLSMMEQQLSSFTISIIPIFPHFSHCPDSVL